MKWIKASERMPENENQYFIYVPTLTLKKVSTFNGKNFEHQFTNKDFEWLDETRTFHTPQQDNTLLFDKLIDETQASDKDKEIEDLKGQSVHSVIKAYIDQLEIKDKEIERLKGLLKDVVFDYNQQKYLRIDIRLTDENYKEIWEIYSIDNNL